MKSTVFLCLALLLFLFTHCKRDFKDYYFHLEDFTETKVYHYVNEEDPEKDQYVEITAFPDENTLFSKAYDRDLHELSMVKEVFTPEGSQLVTFAFVTEGNNQPLLNYYDVTDADAFRWYEMGPYQYKLERHGEAIGYKTIKKTKEYIDVVEVTTMGNSYEALKFKDTYVFDEAVVIEQYSYYAKGLGCVKIEIIGPHSTSVTTLKAILSGKEWAGLLQKKNSKN